MRLTALRATLWPFSALSGDRAVTADADTLIRRFGPAAYEVAEQYSSREDIGLLPTSRPGHWARVAREIVRRSGRTTDQPRLHVAA